MNAKHRFELAIAGYKDVSEQLRRWEAVQCTKGVLPSDAKRAVQRHLAVFDLFALHRAFAVLSEASTSVHREFEQEIERFEAATAALRDQLSRDGTPIRQR